MGDRVSVLSALRGEMLLLSAADVERIGPPGLVREFGVSTVTTLLERDERAAIGLSGLGEAVESAGATWLEVPVPDNDVPAGDALGPWHVARVRLRRRLAAGDRVVIHCRGGLGRTGTLAASLLVSFGEKPDGAMKKVRKARPGALENDLQEFFVRSLSPGITSLAAFAVGTPKESVITPMAGFGCSLGT